MDSLHIDPIHHRTSMETDNTAEQSSCYGRVVTVIEAAIRLAQHIKETVCSFFIQLRDIMARHCCVYCHDENIPASRMTSEEVRCRANEDISAPKDSGVITPPPSSTLPHSAHSLTFDREEGIHQHVSFECGIIEPATCTMPDSSSQRFDESKASSGFSLHDTDTTHPRPSEAQNKTGRGDAFYISGHDDADTIETVDVTALALAQQRFPESSTVSGVSPDDISTLCLLAETGTSISGAFHELDDIIRRQKIAVNPALQMYEEEPGSLTFMDIVHAADFDVVWRLMTDWPEHFEQPQGLLYLLFSNGFNYRLSDSYEAINFEKLTLIVNNLLSKASHTAIVDTLICIYALMKECEPIRPTTKINKRNQHILKILKRYKTQITQHLAKMNHPINVKIMQQMGRPQTLTHTMYRVHSRPFLAVALLSFPQIAQIPVEAHMLARIMDTSSPVSKYQFLYDDLIDCVYRSFIDGFFYGYAEFAWSAYSDRYNDVTNAIIVHAITTKDEAHILQLQQVGILYKASTNPIIEEKIRAITDQPLLQTHAAAFDIKIVSSALPDTSQPQLTWMPDAPEEPDHVHQRSIDGSACVDYVPTNKKNKSIHSSLKGNDGSDNDVSGTFHRANLRAICLNNADLPLIDSTLSQSHSESSSSYSAMPKQLTQPCIVVDSEKCLTEAFHALDAIMAHEHIMLSSDFQVYDLGSPLTFSYTVIAADFALVWDLMTEYPKHFAQTQGILFCLFYLGLANPKRYYFDEIDFEKLTLIIQKLLFSEPTSVLLDTLLCIYYLIEEKVDATKLQIKSHYQADLIFLGKMEEYKTDIINMLEKRGDISRGEIPIEAYILSRALKKITLNYRFHHLCEHFLVDTLYDYSQENVNENWMEFIKNNNEIGLALLLAALKRMDGNMLDYIETTGFQCREFPETLQAQLAREIPETLLSQLAGELAHTLVFRAVETFNLRIDKRLLRTRLRQRIDARAPIPEYMQRSYEILTGEPFDEDDIFDDEEYCYDHTIVLATPSVFDCDPKRFCIKHRRRTTLYEWSINEEKLKLIMGIERPFKGNYKIIIDSHGDGAVISDKKKDSPTELPLGGQYVAKKLHKLIMEKKGSTPSKIALQHCNIGNNIPYLNFRTRFAAQLASLDYQTMMSAPRIGCPELSATTGRKVYHKEGLLGLTIILPIIKKALPFWNEIQTKDKELHDYYIGKDCRRVNNMKATYRIDNRIVTELADPDLPELIQGGSFKSTSV